MTGLGLFEWYAYWWQWLPPTLVQGHHCGGYQEDQVLLVQHLHLVRVSHLLILATLLNMALLFQNIPNLVKLWLLCINNPYLIFLKS